jgi:hypothetical protein
MAESKQVENGRHRHGTEVKGDMPHCQMSDSNLADVFAFLEPC